MATWGSYFASYVKKSDASASGGLEEVKDVAKSEVLQPAETKSTAPISATSNTTSKRSNSNPTVKKLYEIPTEFSKNIPQRSTSNAARVAKLFGYASGNADAAQTKSKLGGVVEQAVAMEKQREEIKKSDIAIPSLFSKGLRDSSGSVVVDSQTSEIVIGLPQDLFANATIVEAEVLTEKRKNPTTTMDVKDMLTSNLPTGSSSDQGSKTQGVGQLNLVSQLVTSKSLVQPPILDSIPKPLVEIKKPIVPPTDSPVSKSIAKKTGSDLGDGTQVKLNTFASTESESAVLKTDSPLSKQPENNNLPNTRSKVQKSANDKVKNDTQAMLALFASQAQDLDSVEDMFNEVPVMVKPKNEARTKPSASSRRKESLGMLDFFASQAEIVSTTSAPAATIQTVPDSPLNLAQAKKPPLSGRVSQPSNAERNLPTPSRRNKSLELLDFFASQAMSTISEDKPLSQQIITKTIASTVLPEDGVLAEKQKPAVIPEITKPSSKWRFAMPKIQEKAKADQMNGAPTAPAAVESILKTGASKAPQPLIVPTDLTFKVASPLRRRSGTSVAEPRTPPVRLTRANTTPSKASFDIRTDTDTQDDDEEEAIDFRERFLEYERQAEKIRLEKEQMEEEQKRMLEEISMFQKEANRIAEEEEAMRKFVESLEGERARDEENENRKRREKEARLEAERIERERIENERFERERLMREEEERLRKEELERIRLEKVETERVLAVAAEKARLEKVEAERAFAQAAEKEKREREARDAKERLVMEEEARKNKEIEDARRRKMEARMEEERRAMEEVERLNAEMLRYAEEAEEDRRLMEEELEREEFERLESERLDEEERLARERRQYQEEQEEFERQRDEEERFARQERRKAKEEAERLQYEKEAAEEEARYYEREKRAEVARKRKEEEAYYAEQDRLAAEAARQAEMFDDDSESEDEIVKAERKIKEAFAGLAKERGQAPAQVQAVAPMKRANTAQTNMQRQQDRGPMIRKQEADVRVSRNNTVGARPMPPRKDEPLMRGQTTRGRPQIRGGLPSGPKRRE